MRLCLLFAVAALAAGCGEEEESEIAWVERPTRVVIEPSSDEFWDLPLPSDRRAGQAEQGYGLSQWPGTNAFIDMWLDAADVFVTDGWGLTPGAFVRLSGPVDESTLPADPTASTSSEASVFLLDIDPDSPERGRRFPLNVSIAPADHLTPEDLLAAVPVFGFVRRPLTQYAMVVTDRVRDAAGERLGRTRGFHDAFEGVEGADAELAAVYGVLRGALSAESYDLGSVVGAAVFTTGDPDRSLRDLAAWTEALDPPSLASEWVVAQEYDSYQVLTATYDSPVLQGDPKPYDREGEGHIVRDEAGEPVIQGWEPVRLVVAVPKSPQPAAGFPLTLYLHGSGGEWYESINRSPREEVPKDEQGPDELGKGPAEWLARRGVAVMGFDFPLHGNRNSPPDTSGLLLYNLTSNPQATINNFQIAVMEVLRLSRLVLSITVDPALRPGVLDAGSAADGLIRFDPDRLTAMGQSMGTTIGIPWASVDPRVKGAVFSGTGGMLIEIGTSALEPTDVNAVFSAFAGFDGVLHGFHRSHPALHAIQHMWDLVDPVVKASHVIVDPFEGVPPKDVVMTAGFRDGYFHPYAQAAVAVPLGVPVAGEVVEPILGEVLELADREPVPFPVRQNLDGKTGAVLHYLGPNTNGHYVVFNQEGARYQYTCFLASVGTAGGALISGPDALDAPCP